MILVARAVFMELARKRDLHIVGLLFGLFIAGALVARLIGIDKPSVGTFLLNLGLSLAYWCAHLLTLLLAVGQLPGEIENRTLYPLLAKPVSRTTVLLGKWIACSLAGCGLFLVLGLATWSSAPKLESYEPALLLQMLLLIPFSTALLAALAILCSLVWTRGVSIVLLGVLLFAGHHITGFLTRSAPAAVRGLIGRLLLYLPDFSKLDLITRYTDGIGPVSAAQFSGLVLYASLLLAVSLLLAAGLFARRPL